MIDTEHVKCDTCTAPEPMELDASDEASRGWPTVDIETNPYKGQFPLFQQHPEIAFLDSAATAQRPACVLDAERDFYQRMNANPLRGLYSQSVEATDAIAKVRQQIADQLHRRIIIAAAEFESRFFKPALKIHSLQRMAAAEVRRGYTDQQRRIGINLIAGIFAHSVGYQTPVFRGRRNNRTAGTHTESIERTPVGKMHRQFIIGSPQGRMSGKIMIAAFVNQRLRMLNPYPDGKGFLFNCRPASKKHFKRIAGTVPDRQNQTLGRLFINLPFFIAN